MKISLCMIVKNEEKYIKRCLEKVLPLVDEAIIVDTGSTDNTKNILNEFGDKIILKESTWKNDFAEARNKSIEGATGDWILVIDADEMITYDKERLINVLETTEYNGFKIPIYSLINQSETIFSCVYCKLYKNIGYRYHGEIHENITIEEDNITDVDKEVCRIIHYGYLHSNVENKQKRSRNKKILKQQIKSNPNDPFVNYNMGNTYMLEEKYDKALDYFMKTYQLSKGISSTYKIVMLKNIAECLFWLKDYDTCIDFLNDLLRDYNEGNKVDLYFILGNCYFENKNYVKAVETINKCIEIGESKKSVSIIGLGSFKAKYMLAKIYDEINDIQNAVMYYMEGYFDVNNIFNAGKEEIRNYLIKHDLKDILNEFDVLSQRK